MQPLDEYALMEWLKEEALKAHNAVSDANACTKCSFSKACGMFEGSNGCVAPLYEDAFNKVITHIQNGRKSQRPHVMERI